MSKYLILPDAELAAQIETEDATLAEVEDDVAQLLWEANWDWLQGQDPEDLDVHVLAIQLIAERIARRIDGWDAQTVETWDAAEHDGPNPATLTN